MIRKYKYNEDMKSRVKTDNKNKCKMIRKYKYNEDMKSRVAHVDVILQDLCYLKKFEQTGIIFPDGTFEVVHE